MTDTAGATELPDVSALQPPDLPDVGTLTAPPQSMGLRGVPYSQAVINRMRRGADAESVLPKLVSGFATGYGDDYNAMTADDFDKIQKLIPSGQPGTFGGAMRFYGQALLNDMARVKASVFSVWGGAVEGISQAAGGVAEQVKPGSGESFAEDTRHNLNILGTDASIAMMLGSHQQVAEATRVVPNPEGGFIDQRIGPVPDHVEAASQAGTIANDLGMPHIAPTIQKAYDQGILPAEIHADIRSNPEILADLTAGEVPKAYPVSDWTGGEAAPQAARAEATGAEAPKVAEHIPTPPTPAGKLPAGAPRPVAGTGEIKTRGLSESTEAVAINEGLAQDFGQLPTYQAVKDTDQGAMAAKLLRDDPEAAMEVAMGTKAAPRGMLPEAAYVAIKNRAVMDGDVETIRNLATQSTLTQQATTMGQRISYLRNVNPENDPVAAIQQVQEARAAALKAKGIDMAANSNEAAAEYAPIRAATRAAKGPDAWEKFAASIRCAE